MANPLALLAPKADRAANLDGVRGIAVLIVLLSHTAGRDQALAPFLDFTGIGHVGVYLFFVLSAFLLGMGMLERGVDRESVRSFFIRRALRILPLYYLALAAVFGWQLVAGSVETKYLHITHGVPGFLQHLALYRGDGVFWTIVVEMQFYLIVPLLAWLLLEFRWRAVFWLLALGALNELLYLAQFLSDRFPHIMAYLSPNTRNEGTFFGFFACGMVAAFVACFGRSYLSGRERLLHGVALGAFVVLCALTVILVSRHFLSWHNPAYGFRYLSPVYAVVFSFFLVSVYLGNPWTSWLRFAPLRFLGITAFSIYLLHFGVVQAVNLTAWPPELKFLASFAGVALLATIIYLAIERPFIRLSYSLTSRRSASSDAGPAFVEDAATKQTPAPRVT